MTYTATATTTYTRTHTATHLADVILGSVADILGTLGLDPTRLFADWDTDQRAISNWINEGSLRCVALECHRPNGTVSPTLEFPVSYRRCCTARSKSLTSLCRLQSHPAQYVSGIPSAAILLSISHPIRCSTRCLANVRARISGPMIAL